jgi:hypothetical protein
MEGDKNCLWREKEQNPFTLEETDRNCNLQQNSARHDSSYVFQYLHTFQIL